MNEKDTNKTGNENASRPKIRIQKINKETPSNVPPKEKKQFKLSDTVDSVKGKLKLKLDAYLDYRRRELNKNDVVFSEALTEEKKQKAVLVKGPIDKSFLICVLLLLVFGAIMSFSASAVYAQNKYDDSAYFFKRYILFALMSIIVSIPAVIFMTPRYWKAAGVVIYCVTIVLLLLVLVIGDTGGGAQRWIAIGPITVQPSEIAKMALVMVLALYMSKHEKEVTSLHQFGGSFIHGVLMPGCLIGLVLVLVALEKHISGIIIIGMIGISVMFLGGTRWKWIFLIVGAVVVAACGLVIVSDYAQARVNTWINIDTADPRGAAWQTLQGLYAIGSGGLFGRGLGNSQQKFGYVSQPQNDFIFTIICEELGFFGALLVVGLFVIFVWRGFKIASHAPNKFCSLVVYGLTFKTALQAALNIAVVTNAIPNTGISLPFFSSGGTALLIQIFEMAIILSISRYSVVKK